MKHWNHMKNTAHKGQSQRKREKSSRNATAAGDHGSRRDGVPKNPPRSPLAGYYDDYRYGPCGYGYRYPYHHHDHGYPYHNHHDGYPYNHYGRPYLYYDEYVSIGPRTFKDGVNEFGCYHCAESDPYYCYKAFYETPIMSFPQAPPPRKLHPFYTPETVCAIM